MKIESFLQLYEQDSLVQTMVEIVKKKEKVINCKGLIGSLDAIMGACIHLKVNQNQLFVLHDREEAAYFCNDLQNLLPDTEILLFPTSYKRPYQYEEIDNANILQRADVLNQINQAKKTNLIVTYPEALGEKVVNKKSLAQYTLAVQVGQTLNIDELSETLLNYDFERTEFVYEAGQFAIRGGIIDIFSYANDLPYRLELFGNDIESIRIFDPHSQLSLKEVKSIAVIPNVQTRLIQEVRESFLDFIPKDTLCWFKDIEYTIDIVQKSFDKAQQAFETYTAEGQNTHILSVPEVLFDTQKEFEQKIQQFSIVQFGKKFHYTASQTLNYTAQPQPSFHKDFKLLTNNLLENQSQQVFNVIATESFKQSQRLESIFEEIDPMLKVQYLHIGLREGFLDKNLKIACYTDHQIFERFYRYKSKEKYSKSKALTLKELQSLQPGDYVTHIDYGIGRFAGMQKVEINGKTQEVIRIVYKDNDLLYINIHALHKISKYTGKEGSPPTISRLGSPEWDNKKKKIKKQVQEIAKELIELYAKRKTAKGHAFQTDTFMQAELESSFIYEDTPDQARATTDIKKDMEQPHPMDRLVCGDVGFGKTEVAVRAAFKAISDGKQVALLVPTTVLAMQHFKTFSERFKEFAVQVEYINRFKTAQQIKDTLKNVAEGKTDLLIGTHRIVSKDIKFKDLGLLIIDEEQKFGVKTKEKLKEFKINIDVLTLTATPIPRTLHFSLMGARDLSVIATPPPNRQPVTTELHTFNDTVVRDAISYEIKRGGQVFFVHNRVNDIEAVANMIIRLVPDAKIGIAHGQMDGARLERAMLKFIEGDYDVLVSTNIIESGLDIPNANTIIINMAHTFGLSDLHQMRGRVGRSNRKAFCYLLTPASSLLSTDSRKRLSALEEFSDLGDGFKVAMRDLDIRGAGNLLGAEQSGFISDLGFEAYHKILDEAIQELKETHFKELFMTEIAAKAQNLTTDCNIETDLQLIIPDDYVNNISERLSLYNQLDNLKEENQLQTFQQTLIDRFGKMPPEVEELIQTVRLRWKAQNIGFSKLTIKNGAMKGFFLDKPEYFNSEKFGQVLQFVQKNPQKARLSEANNKPTLIFSKIDTIQQAIFILSQII
ncbi:MAG: transcription-repair coupling factor [Cytophagales bacterium]|nr:MAG: transcription-repair coupling factor [Cytophagales bacterium]